MGDATTLLEAVAPPPTSGNPSADCLGVINDAAEFALWLSPQILANNGKGPRDGAEDS